MEISIKSNKNKRILIATGIYPPKIGGPAQYAKNLKESFERMGYSVVVKTFNTENRLPTGIRHIFFFLKIIPAVLRVDFIFALDTFSVGLPTVAASRIFGKKVIIRTGGDFLWEGYVERTKKKVLFRNFYSTEKNNLSLKEKIIFLVTKWTLHNTTHIIFSTEWQRDIFINAYILDKNRTSVIENYYGSKESDGEPASKEFIGSTRKLVWKNLDILENVFKKIQEGNSEVSFFLGNLPYEDLMQKMKKSYATILVSLGDISPNMILDSIRQGIPFICTKEIGIYERIKDAGIFVDPLNESEIKNAIKELLTEEGYRKAKERVKSFNFVHTWDEIAKEFLDIANLAKK